MEEKKIIYQMILDIWELTKKYVFIPLDEDGWEQFIKEGGAVSRKYRPYNSELVHLFNNIFNAIADYKSAKDKEANV